MLLSHFLNHPEAFQWRHRPPLLSSFAVQRFERVVGANFKIQFRFLSLRLHGERLPLEALAASQTPLWQPNQFAVFQRRLVGENAGQGDVGRLHGVRIAFTITA